MNNLWDENGGQQMHYTNQNDLYMKHFSEQLPNFTGERVLEMGAGWGGFALMLINKYKIKEYFLLDLEANIQDSVNFLNSEGFTNIKQYYSSNYKELFEKNFDLFVANVVLTEVEKEYREDLLNNVIPNCKNAMIITEINFEDEYGKWLMNLFKNNFDNVDVKITTYGNCYALTGEKNK